MRLSRSPWNGGKERVHMPDPTSMADLDADARQEIKEAVCDAVLERLRRVVSGEGTFGSSVLGDRPSRVLSSGFLLPGINVCEAAGRVARAVTYSSVCGAARVDRGRLRVQRLI